MKQYQFNLSQSQLWSNEIAFPGTAINVISSRLSVEGYATEAIKVAVEKVLANADVFAVELKREGTAGWLVKREKEGYECVVTPVMSSQQADAYMEEELSLPLEDSGLYKVKIIPLKDNTVLVFSCFHHLIMDGYSMSLYGQYILDALAGKDVVQSCFLEDTTPVVDPSMETLWREYFQGMDGTNRIYGDVTEGLNRTEYREVLGNDLEYQIKSYASDNKIGLPYIYLAAYAIYLARATRKKEAIILMSRLGRNREQMHQLGCYVLVVPVRITIEEEDTFAVVCEKALLASKKAASGKWYGYDSIQKIAVEEGIEPEVLTANVYGYFRHAMDSEIPFTYELTGAAMPNDLSFNVMAFDASTIFELELADKVYDMEKGKAFAESIIKILKQGFSGVCTCDMEIVSDSDRAKNASIRGEKIALNTEDTIVSLFYENVLAHGDKVALYAGEEQLTFAQLDEWSSRIASSLSAKGVVKGDSVAFILKRDIRLIPTIFGILKAGGAFIPIDEKYPLERIQYIVKDSGSKYVISSQSVNPEITEWLDIDTLLFGDKAEAIISEKQAINCEDIAYMIYTSGTTGVPKGVRIAHRGIVNIVQPQNNPFNKEITSVAHGLVAVGSISFDISLYEIFVPLLNGLFIELAPEEALTNPSKLAKVISAHGADVMHCTPSRLASYLKLEEFQEVFKQLKAILSAGEVLHSSLVNEIREQYGTKIYNGYGPTETTIGATITEAFDNITIGKPIANMGIMILDEKGRELPYGAMGEICICGVGVGLGYQNLPELTDSKFCEYHGEKVYHSGDLGYLNMEGQLIYYGRCDRQVKLRGLRIELDEVEHGIVGCEGVVSTVCMVRKIQNQQHLVAFYEVHKDVVVEEAVMKAALQVKVPYYMIPDIWVKLEELPQTVSGKIDLKKLEAYPIEYVKTYVAPTNKTEEIVCMAIAQVLNLGEEEKVGIEDSFFDLGGDSLAAALLMLRVEEELGEGCISVADIYKQITAKNMATFILDEANTRKDNPLEKLDYTGFAEALKTSDELKDEMDCAGNVLITGVTGYFGVHILIDLLNRPNMYNKIYCLARNKGKLEAKKRVLSALFYFAEDNYLDQYGTRWEVIEGDITQNKAYESLKDIPFTTVINSAANVAHFGKQEELEKTNIQSVSNLIQFCKEKDACLCQISTISVGGSISSDKEIPRFAEEDFYVGQEINNQYIASKFMSEYQMIRAYIDDGVKVKIIRVGNLQGRIQDGEFQMNMKSNAFTRRITSYIKVGAVSQSIYESMVNFSPVDDTAHMLVTIAGSAHKQVAYNLYPPSEIAFSRLADVLEKLEYPVEVISDKEFAEKMGQMKETKEGQRIVADILIEKPNLGDIMIEADATRTQAFLEAHHEKWNEITDTYLDKCFAGITDMIFF